jgi:vacuolar iron transporter family protein
MELSAVTRKKVIEMQVNEITEYYVYQKIARRIKDQTNKKIIIKIANQEKGHYELWKSFTGVSPKPRKMRIFFYNFLSLVFGYTFALKLMEKGEAHAEDIYNTIALEIPEAKQIALDEDRHEQELLAMLDEERLRYVGSIVLGLNDALVELTGALAGLTFALSDTRIISLSGLITGIAASLSMASSEYLSAKAEGRKDAVKSALYTGTAYILAVSLLILPYLLLGAQKYLALGIMLAIVVFIIFFFNYYISVAKDLPFKKRFFQMVTISLGVAAISFGIGMVLKIFLGVDV